LGGHLSQPTLKIILPVGVSFFTFQSLSYTIDVYRREIPAARSLRDYLMFASFFPQLVAGPIVRPRYFLPQMESKREVTLEQVKGALYLFLLGYIKKACIADNLSPYVDRVFDHSGAYSATASRIAVWLYTTQIFCDFSGYSDMAIAVSALLGYRLVLNFNAPYLAVSIQEFWRRWHISLSTWIRDYIYISLGGRSKTKRLMTYRNMLLTMLAGGLWHGAAWTFVAWGGAHGTGQVIHQEFQHRVPLPAGRDELEQNGRSSHRLVWRSIAGWFVTLNFVCLCWILFRAPDFATALLMAKRYLFLNAGGTERLPLWLAAVGPALLLGQLLMRRWRLEDHVCGLSLPRFALVYGGAVALALSLLPLGYRPFLYFQF
jgi:alginate O-acetyltransferase complex protein AlgI